MREYVRRSYMYEGDNAGGNDKQRGEARESTTRGGVDLLVSGIAGLIFGI